jgi:hypothetical protein
MSYRERLENLNLPSLKYRRFRGDLIQLYKITNNIDDIDFNNFFTTNTNITRNSNNKLYVNYSRTNIRKFTYSNRVVKYWNPLKQLTKNAPNLTTFKSLLDRDPNKIVDKFDFDE